MTIHDLKLTIVNSIILGLTFTNLEQSLKIFLLIVSVVYTTFKALIAIFEFIDKRKQIKNNDN